jgi:hypothetical protein
VKPSDPEYKIIAPNGVKGSLLVSKYNFYRIWFDAVFANPKHEICELTLSGLILFMPFLPKNVKIIFGRC